MILLFDFDGTLADTTLNGIRVINKIADKYGFNAFDENQIERYKTMTNLQIIKESGLPLYRLPKLIKEYKKLAGETIQNCQPFDGIPELLSELVKDHDLYIISSNSVENITKFLDSHNLKSYFIDVFSEPNLFGKHRAINRVIKRLNLEKDKCIYIGDEVRDIEASRKSNVKVISVAWGINTKGFLAEHNPDGLSSSVLELKSIIKNLSN